MNAPQVTVERCLEGRLAKAYPAARHDVELRVEGVPTEQLSDLLLREAARIFDEDAACRKIVFGAPVDDLEIIAAAEDAGFRYVVGVDLPGAELSLLVREPEWVTAVDMDLDRVPQA